MNKRYHIQGITDWGTIKEKAVSDHNRLKIPIELHHHKKDEICSDQCLVLEND